MFNMKICKPVLIKVTVHLSRVHITETTFTGTFSLAIIKVTIKFLKRWGIFILSRVFLSSNNINNHNINAYIMFLQSEGWMSSLLEPVLETVWNISFLSPILELYSEIALSQKPFEIGHMYIYNYLLQMTDNMTSQNIDLSSWDIVYS
jgi:hypothetical protein